jgi:hypothetical protein
MTNIRELSEDERPEYKFLGQKFIFGKDKHTHFYKTLPYTATNVVTLNDKIIDIQTRHYASIEHKVIYNGRKTTVILQNGIKGVATCHPDDKYDKFLGYEIAYNRARIKRLEKEIGNLIRVSELRSKNENPQ